MSVASRAVFRAGSQKRATRTANTLIYCLLALGTVMAMGPFLWTVSGSLMTDVEVQSYPPKLFPAEVQWGNYPQVWREVPFARWILNSVTVVVFALIGTIASSSIVAYSFARFRYPGRNLLFMVMLSTMMLPQEVTLIPTYLLFRELKWLDTLKPLIVPAYFGGGAFNIFLMRQFIMTIPREFDEAALIDGANYLRIFFNVLLPLLKPVLATVMVLNFIGTWNDFMGPLIYLNSPKKFTLALGMRYFSVNRTISIPVEHLLMATCVMSTMPCLILFFSAQRYFVQGIVMSGIKG